MFSGLKVFNLLNKNKELSSLEALHVLTNYVPMNKDHGMLVGTMTNKENALLVSTLAQKT